MPISWEQFVDAFRVGSDTGNIEQLASMITEDFNWVTSDMDREATLSWTSGTSFKERRIHSKLNIVINISPGNISCSLSTASGTEFACLRIISPKH